MMNTPDKVQHAWRGWLRKAISHSGMKPTPFAEAAGLAPSTVIRALDEDNPSYISLRTIEKIVDRHNVPPPDGLGLSPQNGHAGHGFAEPEVVEITGEPPKGIKETSDPNRSNWTITGRSLSLAGYMPGDIVTIDMAVPPRGGDVVIAQIYDLQRGTAETVIRKYQTSKSQPYLVTASADAEALAIAPEFVDNERVSVIGTVIRSVRLRQ